VAKSDTKDFRKARWESREIALKEGEPVNASIAKPEKGFIAYYADLGYEIDGLPQWLCTQLKVAAAE
jgi:hypothetical protein